VPEGIWSHRLARVGAGDRGSGWRDV